MTTSCCLWALRAPSGEQAILLLAEEAQASRLAGSFSGTVLDFREETRYALELFDLVLTLHAISLDHNAFSPLREAMDAEVAPGDPAARINLAPSRRPVSRNGKYSSPTPGTRTARRVAAELDRAFQDEGILIVQDHATLASRATYAGSWKA